MDNNKLAMIQSTLAGGLAADHVYEQDADEDQEAQFDLAENGEPLEELEEFDIDQI